MKLDMEPLPKSNLDRAWVGQTEVVWAQYRSHWIQQWLVVLEANLIMAMVDISVQIWPSESGIWIVQHFSTWEGGLLGAIHTVSVSGPMLSLAVATVGDRVMKGLDLSYVVSTSFSSFLGMGGQHTGMLAWGCRLVVQKACYWQPCWRDDGVKWQKVWD